LNRSQGTTFLVVTHDLGVARQTNRVLFMQDGRIIREDIIGTPLEEDLKLWRHSGLGKHILAGDREVLDKLELLPGQEEAVRQLLEEQKG
jgi:ABC-type dipeptide/oligopeptide/nickel transport system ATPase component